MGAQGKSPRSSNSMQVSVRDGLRGSIVSIPTVALRVKVYHLSEDGKWDDRGTGHVTVDYVELSALDVRQRSEDLGLFVIDEEDNETLLAHRIRSDDIYRTQEDLEIGPRPPTETLEAPGTAQGNDETFHNGNSELRELPAVELSTLPFILKTLLESGVADHMRITELIVQDQDFFPKLMDLFRICEDMENIDSLHMIFKIVKGINDPEISRIQHHRTFLKEHVIFKEAIPIKDPSVVSKIHETYRIGYIKDVVLPRVLDEATVASLNSIIHANNAVLSISIRDLVNEGIFDIITDVLQSEDKNLVLTGTDVLILFLNQDPNLLRSYVTRQDGNALLGLLVKGMITDFGEDMNCQFLEIIRSLLDSYTLSGSQQRETIIEIFYEKHLDQLIDVIVLSCPQSVLTGDLENHPLLEQLKAKDEQILHHIAKNNLLKPIVEAFVANGNRYNLLNSAVLELFGYIRKFQDTDDIRSLITAADQRKRIDARALEKEEEDYFNEDRSTTGGLVDYEDDDDEEDLSPPSRSKLPNSQKDKRKVESKHSSKRVSVESEDPDLAKRRRVDEDSADSNVSHAANSSDCSDSTSPVDKSTAPMLNGPQNAESKSASHDEAQPDKAPAVPRSCSSCLPNAVDARSPAVDECSLVPPNGNSALEKTANGTNSTGSEPYSVR
ncbi:hypothetical protein Syun_008064 [Stephania yunnanensis]|uniref:Serine/threonine-protein phosphatase 4 regulatory subunit 3-like central domain-containing protein n=1 Tax=Stephania yunnanensis TaxID=152371 RepID=A0AAP0PZE0_9MAGN